jgi:uncharacterized protein (TIGR03492 family)
VGEAIVRTSHLDPLPQLKIHDRISNPLKLLTLSNGHGEDEVAVRVLRQIRQQCPGWYLQALPIVGEGHAYTQADIPIYGCVRTAMPSGGFIYMDWQRVLKDLKSGLFSLTWSQLQDCRRWASEGGSILAVGDIVPLLFAWFSGAPYNFIGTAKSEYYLRQDDTALKTRRWPWHRWLDCDYLPWERAFMQHPRCKGVFPRDRLTAQFLQQWPIPVFDLGNPMLDDLEPKGIIPPHALPEHRAAILLLPGSRPPEAYANWQLILEGITPLALQAEPLVFVGAIAPQLNLTQLQEIATTSGWQLHNPSPAITVPHVWLTIEQAHLLIVPKGFSDGLHLADLAIAMTGTATEQCVGFGKPVITLPGKGPQFIWAFAEAQTRLLGQSIHLVENPHEISGPVRELLQLSQRQSIYQSNGFARMGKPGASERIAAQIQQVSESSP